MNWAYHPDTRVGDTNIFFRNVAVLVEATENGFIEISSGKYEKVRSVYEQAHRESNRGLYANLSRIESRRGTDSWDLQYVEDGRYDVRDAQQDESQGFQTDSERDNEHLRSGDKREPVKFQLRSNVEETKDLVAVHNLSEEKLLKSLKLGGLPMPSIGLKHRVIGVMRLTKE